MMPGGSGMSTRIRNTAEKIRILIPGIKNDVKNYCEVLEKLGADVCVTADISRITEDTAREFDGLLIPGGEDIDPARYGQENTGCRTIVAIRP
jgi:putative glutamine amidotransferase